MLDQLRRELPADFPVRMRRRRDLTADCNGTCTLLGKGKRRRYSIVLRATLSVELAVVMLMHEYAHALAWTAEVEAGHTEHSPAWARAYARVYRTVHGD